MALQSPQDSTGDFPQVESFPQYGSLPYEIRTSILHFALHDSMSWVRTLAVTSSDADESGLPQPLSLSIITQGTLVASCPLWYVGHETHTEISRLCRLLLHRRILSTGANAFSLQHGQGQLPLLLSVEVAQRYVHRHATVFFLDEANAATVFMHLNTHSIPDKSPLRWITQIMLAGRTFVHLLLFHRRDNPPQGLPFTLLPALRTIRVGFLQRFQDVVHIEGPLAEVASTIEEIDIPARANPEINLLLGTADSVPLFLFYETVQPTVEDVEALRGRGVGVIWCAVKDGIIRRVDIENHAGVD